MPSEIVEWECRSKIIDMNFMLKTLGVKMRKVLNLPSVKNYLKIKPCGTTSIIAK
jgi:hypothetical protein